MVSEPLTEKQRRARNQRVSMTLGLTSIVGATTVLVSRDFIAMASVGILGLVLAVMLYYSP